MEAVPSALILWRSAPKRRARLLRMQSRIVGRFEQIVETGGSFGRLNAYVAGARRGVQDGLGAAARLCRWLRRRVRRHRARCLVLARDIPYGLDKVTMRSFAVYETKVKINRSRKRIVNRLLAEVVSDQLDSKARCSR
ncbi:ATP-dependent DNA helicase recQ [Pseudozyma hubeiensis SY62]|uniref:ATP-dependent DNA helicase recQ n=1 Tax=Pseudozyma hubeiensis (strain SY62) TaxID=1305764 RepID=R9P7V0_PSEHS|nr:ATP-dependent DNA helicase recQ [Pseudozyma hubeiensis SY62]GAC97436.1 ATP-dependent DNA helicase recQ [Pseudozyma hubeiensis SY62]